MSLGSRLARVSLDLVPRGGGAHSRDVRTVGSGNAVISQACRKWWSSHLLRIRNASQLVLVCSGREKALKGTFIQNRHPGCGHGQWAEHREGRIAAIGSDHEVDSRMDGCPFEQCINASGMSVVPGLVDAHTHPVWVWDRVHEFAMKIRS